MTMANVFITLFRATVSHCPSSALVLVFKYKVCILDTCRTHHLSSSNSVHSGHLQDILPLLGDWASRNGWVIYDWYSESAWSHDCAAISPTGLFTFKRLFTRGLGVLEEPVHQGHSRRGAFSKMFPNLNFNVLRCFFFINAKQKKHVGIKWGRSLKKKTMCTNHVLIRCLYWLLK